MDYRDIYLPQPEIVEALRGSVMINSQEELDLMIQICMAVKAWAFDTKYICKASAIWVYSTFGVQEYAPHDFYKYYLDDIRILGFTILEHTGIGPQIDKKNTFPSIKHVMSDLFPEMQGIQEIPDALIRSVMKEFISYLHNDPEIFNGKRASEIYRAIDYAKEAASSACVRVPKSTSVMYEYFDNIQSVPIYTFECEYCGENCACIQSTSAPICESCLAKRDNDDKNVSCDHVECSQFACSHYRGTEELDDYYVQR